MCVVKFDPVEKKLSQYKQKMPVSITVRSKASTVFSRSDVEIAGSSPARGMDVCLRYCVCVVLCR
jgi:hypothetical protein